MFIPLPKATLLIPSGSANNPDKKHFFVILTKQNNHGELLIVSLSSIKPGNFHDKTCLLYPGDHPFIRHDSYVNYRHARIEAERRLRLGIRDGKFIPHDPFGDEIFFRICQGIMESRFTAHKIKEFYRCLNK